MFEKPIIDLILFLVQLTLTCGSIATSGQYFEIFEEKILSGHTLSSKYGVNQIECSLLCQNHAECFSANHHKNKKICHLKPYVYNFNDNGLVEAVGWTFLHLVRNIDVRKEEVKKPEGPDFIITQDTHPVEGRLFHIIPETSESWSLSLDIVPKNVSIENYQNVIFLMFKNKTTSMLTVVGVHIKKDELIIKFPLNGEQMTFTPKLNLQVDQQISLKMKQKREINCGFGKCVWRFKIYINNIQIYENVNNYPKIYRNFKCYLSKKNTQSAKVIVKRAKYRSLSEEISVRPNNVIGEIPFMWPPYHGYMSFKMKRLSEEIYDEENAVLNVKSDTIGSTRNLPKIRPIGQSFVVSTATKDSRNVELLQIIPALNTEHRIVFFYKQSEISTNDTDLRFYFDGALKKTLTARFSRFKGLKIYAGEERASENIVLRSFEFGLYETQVSANNFLGYVPFKWPPKNGYLKVKIMKLDDDKFTIRSDVLCFGLPTSSYREPESMRKEFSSPHRMLNRMRNYLEATCSIITLTIVLSLSIRMLWTIQRRPCRFISMDKWLENILVNFYKRIMLKSLHPMMAVLMVITLQLQICWSKI
ncbi:uncharacterized protein [Clytia hemisphaerica]|uniref:Apple domain-containing protein n=1 Tax=Clytia hemisphaerica TaxID=252671 RepID=A0A7M5WW80_9CNID